MEDHPVMREGLASWFAGTGRWEVAGTAATLTGAKELLTEVEADVALLDIQLEDGWGLDIIPWLLRTKYAGKKAGLPVMAVYSGFEDYTHVSAAMSMGARAYVSKRRSERELEQALLKALDGETFIDETAQIQFATVSNIFSLLSRREAEILSLVKDELSNQQIADRLGISRRTVENTLSWIYDKTGIRSRLELQKL
ncbi:MAG: response regulator transcription factor [Treponema sp.]|nr:response regulator transcription factor [Treponema sp.]